MQSFKQIAILVAVSATGLSPVFADTVSPVQSKAAPFGLQRIGLVQLAGSDDAAANFSANALPDLQASVNNTLTESQPLANLSAIALDPNDLVISGTADVRAYFVGEGAGYRNSFGVYTGDSSDGLNGDAALILPDASSSSSYLNPTASSYRSRYAPVAAGDFVDLGTFENDTQLNLFLIANGANGGTETYYTDMSLNRDGIDHFVVLATPDSPYLLIGTEDLFNGGDKDYNDLVVALDVGRATAQKLISKAVPLPAPVIALFGPLFFIGMSKWKRRRTQKPELFAHAD